MFDAPTINGARHLGGGGGNHGMEHQLGFIEPRVRRELPSHARSTCAALLQMVKRTPLSSAGGVARRPRAGVQTTPVSSARAFHERHRRLVAVGAQEVAALRREHVQAPSGQRRGEHLGVPVKRERHAVEGAVFRFEGLGDALRSGVGALYVSAVCAFDTFSARSRGASAQPTRQPVRLKSLPADDSEIVRSRARSASR